MAWLGRLGRQGVVEMSRKIWSDPKLGGSPSRSSVGKLSGIGVVCSSLCRTYCSRIVRAQRAAMSSNLALFGMGAGGLALLGSALISFRSPASPEGPALEASDKIAALRPAALATIGATSLLYIFLYNQSRAAFVAFKLAKKEAKEGSKVSFLDIKYGGKSKVVLAADRAVGNMLEQLPAAMSTLWLVSLFVDGGLGGQLGWAWIATRALYPVLFTRGLPWILLSTLPGYAIISFGLLRTVLAIGA